MKYVSPIFEVEAFETEDIMNNPSTYVPGVTLLGNTNSIITTNNQTGTFTEAATDAEGNEIVDEVTGEPIVYKGVSVSVDFNTLFNSGNTQG